MHAALIQASEKTIKNQRSLNAIGGYIVVRFKQKAGYNRKEIKKNPLY